MLGFKIYILSAILSLFSASYHHVHVSVLNMEYSSGKPTIELSFKTTTADFELAIGHNYNVALNLGQANECADADKLINKYIATTFKVLINNKYRPEIVSIRKETVDDVTWIYTSILVSEPIKNITIHNALLMDIFMDQTNLLIFSINKKETGYRLDFYNREVEIVY